MVYNMEGCIMDEMLKNLITLPYQNIQKNWIILKKKLGRLHNWWMLPPHFSNFSSIVKPQIFFSSSK